MDGIYPTVRIMEIQHKISSRILDAFAQCCHISQVLADSIVHRAVVRCLLLRIDEYTDTESVPTAVVHRPSDQVTDLLAVHILVAGAILFELGQHRYVAAYITGSMQRNTCHQQNEGKCLFHCLVD